MSPELIILLVIALTLTYFLHKAVIAMMETCLIGLPPSLIVSGRFWLVLCQRFFGYVLLPLTFSIFGAGASLLPNPQFRAVVEQQQRRPHVAQPMPYAGERIPGWRDADVGRLKENFAISIIGTLIIISSARVLIARYHERLVAGLVYLVLSFLGFVIFTYLFDLYAATGYYHTLIDTLRYELPGSQQYILASAAVTCVVTEYILAKF